MKSKKRVFLILTILTGLLVGSVLLTSALGVVFVPLSDIAKMSLDKLPFVHLEPTWQPTHETILFQIRLPRVVGGALVGAALATAGVLFQGLLRNPLADPYIIGTSSGALFGATLVIIFIPATLSLWGFGIISIAAFLGALGAVFLVYNLARVGGKTPVVSLVLAGFAVGAFFTAITWFMLSASGEFQHKLGAVFDFLVGAIRVSNWLQVAVAACLILSGIVLARFFAFRLNAFSLGEEGAAYLGINVERDKLLILGLGSFLTAYAVCLGGLIGFVGLVMPHAMRLVLGPDHRLLLPAAALAGASFIILADLGARIIFTPTELRLGILTALIGAPFFIYLLRRHRKEYAF
ncbi:MAG: FecCD family ABC transporter permease [Dehalococcoidales bacterium]